MKKSLLIAILFCMCLQGFSQQTDSAAYDFSFVRFHEYGKGQPVIILSGGPGNNCRQLEDLAIRAGRNNRAILLEQRGTGLSLPALLNKQSVNLDFVTRDILSLMDSLQIDKAILLGHSWGALLATRFAIAYPGKVHSMILIGPGPLSYENKYWDQLVANKRSRITTEQWKQYLQRYFKVNTNTIDSIEMKEYKRLNSAMVLYDTTHADVFTSINKGERNQQTFLLLAAELQRKEYDLTHTVGGLSMPIDIITGKEDPAAFLTTAYQQFAPAAAIHWIERSGHFPMFEQPEAFYAVLMKLLAR